MSSRDWSSKIYLDRPFRLDWPAIVQAFIALGVLHLMIFALLFGSAFTKG